MHPFLSRAVIYPLQEKLLNRPTFEYLATIEKSQWLTRQEIEELQRVKLQKLLSTAQQYSPWHSKRLIEAGLDINNLSLQDLQKLPTMNKQDAQLNGEQMVWHGVPGGAYKYSTGGSSGQPLIFYFGRMRQASDAACRIRARRWWGVNVGDPEVYLWGAPVELNKTDKIKTIRDRLLNQLLLNAFAMSPEMMGDYLNRIQAFKPRCIYGYASSVALLAAYAQNNQKVYLPELKVVCTTGEPLYPEQRKLIEETFGVPVANEYGSRDSGLTTHETPDKQLLLMSESMIVEALDAAGNPVNPGEMGEAVITGLCSEAQPFIRYRTGDMISLSNTTDKQGRGLHVLEKIEGRTTDFLVHSNGSIMHGLSVIYILRETPGVERFKIIQHKTDEFEIQIISNSLWQESAQFDIINKFRARFGQNVSVNIVFLDQILPEASGKIRQVISHVKYDL